MKILIVDDYSTMRRIIRNLLGQIGYSDVWESADGADALSKLQEVRFDLVISDLNMEPMTGLDLRKRMLEDKKLRGIPFLLVTPEGRVESVAAFKSAGASSCIVKPFNAASLQTKINGILESKPA